MKTITAAAVLLAAVLSTAQATPVALPTQSAAQAIALDDTGLTHERICMRRCPGFN
jgi:hypothetical protein